VADVSLVIAYCDFARRKSVTTIIKKNLDLEEIIMTQLPVLVAAIDGSKARFLTLAAAGVPGLDPIPQLIEYEGITLPEGELLGEELWSSTKTGRNRGPQGQFHSYDDHREHHALEFERHFARSIASQMNQLIQEHQIREVLLVAAPQVLGIMREALTSALPNTIKIADLNKDLTQLTAYEIHHYLAEKALLPAPQREGIE
jgi:protein required for attachment to host cells